MFGITHIYVGYLRDTGISSAFLRYNTDLFSDDYIQVKRNSSGLTLGVVVKNTIFHDTYGKRE